MTWVASKKGDILPEEVVKLLISAIAIGLLILLGVLLYKTVSFAKDKEQAGEILKQLKNKIEIVKDSGSMSLVGPKEWHLYKEEGKLCVIKGEDPKNKVCVSIKEMMEVTLSPAEIGIYFNEISITKKTENGIEKVSIQGSA